MGQRSRTVALIRMRVKLGVVTPRRPLPKPQQPDAIRLAYAGALLPYVQKAHALVERELVPYLPHLLDDIARRQDSERFDVSRVASIVGKVARQAATLLEPKQLWWVAHHYGERTDDFQKDQFRAAVRAGLGVDLGLLEPNLTSTLANFVTDNVALIKSLPTQYVADVEKHVMLAAKSGERWESLAKTLEERNGIAENRARLIARDQVGKFYGQVNQERQKALGVTGYVWRCVQDERVRDEHEERDGEHFEWSEPPEDGHPGEPVLCRCWPEPDFSDLVEGLS